MRAERERGFTLVEVLVAMVMVALLTTILIDGASNARARTAHAAHLARAVFIARTLVARAAVAPFDASPDQGTTNGYGWQISQRVILPDPRGLYGLVAIEARVTDPNGTALYTAETRRLKAMPRG